jgi:glutathione S-transferase
MITVYHLNRSRSLRIVWLLEEIGQPYKIERFERDAQTNLAPKALRDIHPLGKSPMIDLGGLRVAESGAIVETLCARFAPHMVPEPGTEAHLRHLEWMHFAEGSAMTPILLNLYVGRLGEAGAPLHPRIESELKNHFGYMEDSLRPSGHFVLDELSAADILLSFPASIAGRLPQTKGHYPKLEAFTEAMSARPAYQRALTAAGGD